MNNLDTWLVDIDAIDCKERGYLNIELANLIYQAGGCTKPMVLRETGIDKYKVVCGINTFANVKYITEEIDDDFELIRAYIAKTDKEEEMLTELYCMEN